MNRRAEAAALPDQSGHDPLPFFRGSGGEPKSMHPHRYEFQPDQHFTLGVKGQQVEKPQIWSILLVTPDTLVIVDEIATPIQDRPVPVNLYAERMM